MLRDDFDPSSAEVFYLTADRLKGKQSVRVTFRLPGHSIALLSIAANHLGVQQKLLFDQLVENQEVLNRLADEGRRSKGPEVGERIQKTYVISRSSLTALKNIAAEYRISRDLLVELSINRLEPVVSAEHEKAGKRQTVHHQLVDFLAVGHQTLEQASELLDQEDPVLRRLKEVMAAVDKGCEEIAALCKQLGPPNQPKMR